MKWLLIIFVGSQLAGTVEMESEQSCKKAVQTLEQKIIHPGPREPRVRLACLPKGIPE